MTDKDAGEAARRIVKAFTTGGAYKGDDPVIVARAYLDANDQIMRLVAEIERLRAALTECSAPYDSGPTTVLDGARLVAAEFQRRMDIAGSALSPLPAPKEPKQ